MDLFLGMLAKNEAARGNLKINNQAARGQSEAYFTVLKRLGKVVEMVRFPDCSHLFLRQGHPRLREEYLARTLNWFQKYL